MTQMVWVLNFVAEVLGFSLRTWNRSTEKILYMYVSVFSQTLGTSISWEGKRATDWDTVCRLGCWNLTNSKADSLSQYDCRLCRRCKTLFDFVPGVKN